MNQSNDFDQNTFIDLEFEDLLNSACDNFDPNNIDAAPQTSSISSQ